MQTMILEPESPRVPVSIPEQHTDGDVLASLIHAETIDVVREAVGTLSENHRQIVLLYFGFGDDPIAGNVPRTCAEIGKSLGMSRREVHDSLASGLGLVRDYLVARGYEEEI